MSDTQTPGQAPEPQPAGGGAGYPPQPYGAPAADQPPYAQPAYAPPAYAQPAYAPPAYAQPAYAQPAYAQAPAQKSRNVVGIIALIVAALGFVLACVPGAMVIGWVLLPIGFILGIVAVCLSGKVKWQGITAIIVSVVGTIVGVIVFFAVVATSFSNAFGDNGIDIDSGPVVVDGGEAPEGEGDGSGDVGTRANPAALGSTIENDEWTVVVNEVTTDATDEVIDANQFNDEPDAGHEYIIINYTVTYNGDDEEGQMPAFVGVEFVTSDGVTYDGLDKMIVGPDEMDTMTTLYNGGTVTGNTALQVPSPADGVVAVSPGMFADTVFVAIK